MRIFITLVMCYLLALPAALAEESFVEENENRLQRELDWAEREKTSFSLYRQFFSDTEMDSLLILKKKFFEEKFREAVSKHFSAEDESVELDTTRIVLPCHDLVFEQVDGEMRGFGIFDIKEDSVFALSEARKMAAYSIASENINRVGEFFVDENRTFMSTKSLKEMMVRRFRLWEHILDHSEVICSGKYLNDDVCVAIKMDSNTLSEYALSLRIKKPEQDFQKLYDENKDFQFFVKDELRQWFLDDILLY